MTGLLVSVRSGAEAAIALRCGVDLIDVKEPSRGSLGAADAAVQQEVIDLVSDRVPVSVALGELADYRPPTSDFQLWSQGAYASRSPSYAKLGLAHAAAMSDWQARWTATMQTLPSGTKPVAVAYADWQHAASPAPAKVLAAAAQFQASFLLIDTFDKSRGNLLAHASLAELTDLSARAAEQKNRLVLAGSLDIEAIRAVLPLGPAYIAVRGEACAGERTQAIDAARVKRLVELVRTGI
jgi:(5-formylfuran-3-yl)methyl phosphate synthase